MKNKLLQIGILLLFVGVQASAQRYVDPSNVYVSIATNYGETYAVDLDFENDSVTDYPRIMNFLSTAVRTQNSIIPTLKYVYSDTGNSYLARYNKTNTAQELITGNLTLGRLAIYGDDLYYEYPGGTFLKYQYEDMAFQGGIITSGCVNADYEEFAFTEDEIFVSCSATSTKGYMIMDHALTNATSYNVTASPPLLPGTEIVDGVYALDVDDSYVYLIYREGTNDYLGSFYDGGEVRDYANLTEAGFDNGGISDTYVNVVGNYIYVVGFSDLYLANQFYVMKYDKSLNLVDSNTFANSISAIADVDTDYDNHLYVGTQSVNNSVEGLYAIKLSDLTLDAFVQDNNGVRGLGISSYKGGSGAGQTLSTISVQGLVHQIESSHFVGVDEMSCYLFDELGYQIRSDTSNSSGLCTFTGLTDGTYQVTVELDSSAYPDIDTEATPYSQDTFYEISGFDEYDLVQWQEGESAITHSNLTVAVYDYNTKDPIEFAEVNLTSDNPPDFAHGWTDANGIKSFYLPRLDYALTIEKEGYYTYIKPGYYIENGYGETYIVRYLNPISGECSVAGLITENGELQDTRIDMSCSQTGEYNGMIVTAGAFNITGLNEGESCDVYYEDLNGLNEFLTTISVFDESSRCSGCNCFINRSVETAIDYTFQIFSDGAQVYDVNVRAFNTTEQVETLAQYGTVFVANNLIEGANYTIGVKDSANYIEKNVSYTADTESNPFRIDILKTSSSCFLKPIRVKASGLYNESADTTKRTVTLKFKDKTTGLPLTDTVLNSRDKDYVAGIPTEKAVRCGSSIEITVSSDYFKADAVTTKADLIYTPVSVDMDPKTPEDMKGELIERTVGEGITEISKYGFWGVMILVAVHLLFFISLGMAFLGSILK